MVLFSGGLGDLGTWGLGDLRLERDAPATFLDWSGTLQLLFGFDGSGFYFGGFFAGGDDGLDVGFVWVAGGVAGAAILAVADAVVHAFDGFDGAVGQADDGGGLAIEDGVKGFHLPLQFIDLALVVGLDLGIERVNLGPVLCRVLQDFFRDDDRDHQKDGGDDDENAKVSDGFCEGDVHGIPESL